MPDFGPQKAVRSDLKKWLALQAWTKRGDFHWIARPVSKRVNVEVIGEPVRQISVVVPIARGAGSIVGQVINTYVPASEEARAWVAEELGIYGDNPTEPIDIQKEFDGITVRIQSFLELVVLTLAAASDGQ